MKSRVQELLDKSVSAMISAIEVYNKPDFKYREETFAILAINAWELIFKAKWLSDNGNLIKSLYVTEKKTRSNGEAYKHPKFKLTASGNPFTHGVDYLSAKLEEKKVLATPVKKNVAALCEVRDCAVHFYNRHSLFAIRLQEIGSASVRNFVKVCQDWFSYDLSRYNFYLMPLSFFPASGTHDGIVLNREEKNLVRYIEMMDAANDPDSGYAVTVNVELKFSRSTASDA